MNSTLVKKMVWIGVSLMMVCLLSGALWAGPVTNGLQLWLDASAITGLGNGSKVSTWMDSSGNGNHAVQSNTDHMPEYYGNQIGGRPIVYFEGGMGYQSAANGDGLTTLNPIAGGDHLTIFLMQYQLYENGERGIISNMDGSGGFRLFDGKGEHENEYWFSKPGNAFHAGASLYGAIQILAVRVDGVNTSFWTDGVLDISVPDTTPVGTSASVLKIGKGTGSDMDYWAYMADLLIYNRALSDAEMNQTGYYLAEKYSRDTSYVVPEPGSILALGSGLFGLLGFAIRRRK